MRYNLVSGFGALLCTLFISAFASVTHAGVSDNVNPTTLGNIDVELSDDANDGCWTNLGEAKTYAADKLDILGYKVLPKWVPGMATFQVSVHSERDSQKTCYGNIAVTVYIAVYNDEVFGFHRVAEKSTIFLRSKNANTLVLEVIKSLIDQMREKQN